MRVRTGVSILGAAITVLALLPGLSASAAVPEPAQPVVRTEGGAVRGVHGEYADSFRGIPYAAPPVGALRWQSPRPARPWQGVRPAENFGARCAQQEGPYNHRSEAEDCLFVNVDRPAGIRPGERRPVYVFIHGGGLTSGASDGYHGQKLAAKTGAVVVTLNYRLGPFGFLGHPALTAQAGESGNYGLQDQQAALRWVQRNIAAFGGNPHRVTIGGESAGGWSVCGHLTSPGSRGLFAAAMIQSGSCHTQSQRQSEQAGGKLAGQLGCTDPATAARCLRRIPAARLVDTAPQEAAFAHGTPTLPVAPREAVRTGEFTRVPVVSGANLDEGRMFSLTLAGPTREDYIGWLRQNFGANADAVLRHYPWPAKPGQFTTQYRIGAILTDMGLLGLGGCPHRALTADFARHTRTYAYEFAHRSGPGPAKQPEGYEWGAAHAAELAYLWPELGFDGPVSDRFDESERRLATEMTRYWGAFFAHRTPRVPGQPEWPRHRPGGETLSLRAGGASTPISDAEYAAAHQCGFWDRQR